MDLIQVLITNSQSVNESQRQQHVEAIVQMTSPNPNDISVDTDGGTPISHKRQRIHHN